MKLDSIKFPKQKSVRGGWFLSYILVLIVPLLLCLLLYNYSAGIITAESKRIYGSALDQARIDLDSYLTEIEQTLSRTMQDQTVQRIVTTKKPLDGYDQLAMVNTQSALLTIETGHPNVTNVWISLNNLDSVISSRGYLDQHLFYLSRFKNSSLSEDAWRELLHECHPRWEMVQVENEGGTDFLFIRSALTSGLSYADATVVVTVNKKLFVKRLQQFCWDPELDFYVLAPDGTALCKTAEGDPPAMDIVQAAVDGSFAFGSGSQQAYLTRASSVTDWQYVLSISNKLLMKNTRMTQLFTWGGMVLCMMLGLGLSAGLTKKNYQPLGALVSPYDGTDEAPELVEKNEFERLEYYSQKSRRERSDQQHELWKSQQTLRRYYLKSLLESPMGLSQETAERGGIRFDALFYTVVVFKNPMADSAPEGDGSLFAALQIAIMNIFQEIAEPHFALELTALGETCVAIVGMQENTLAQDEQLLADIRETQQQVRAHFCVNPGAAVGETHAGAADIRAAYQEALEALSYLRGPCCPRCGCVRSPSQSPCSALDGVRRRSWGFRGRRWQSRCCSRRQTRRGGARCTRCSGSRGTRRSTRCARPGRWCCSCRTPHRSRHRSRSARGSGSRPADRGRFHSGRQTAGCGASGRRSSACGRWTGTVPSWRG